MIIVGKEVRLLGTKLQAICPASAGETKLEKLQTWRPALSGTFKVNGVDWLPLLNVDPNASRVVVEDLGDLTLALQAPGGTP